jgi:CubicO group peptidase (beta-lactamase class C family)
MKRTYPWLIMALLLVSGAFSSRAGAPSDPIDTYIRVEMEKRRIPGLALAVIRQGQVIKMQGYGLANVELDVPVTPDTVFELASVTKQFTATAIMRLVEEGKVGLDDPIRHYLPHTPDAWQGITVRHLLTHTAGLASLEAGFHALYAGGARTNYTTAEMFEAATKDPMSFEPGERWQYSDVGYFLLGIVLEKASGQRYHEWMTEHFFQPLGMTATSVLDQWAILKHRASGYTLRDGQLVHIRRHAQVELPSHYGIFSTVKDLVTWEAALTGGHVVKPSSLKQMWTPVKLHDGTSHPYGFGWGVDERRGHRLISHTGITGTEYTRLPDDGLTVIVLTNLGRCIGTTGVKSWGLTIGVAGRYLPDLLLSSLQEQPDTDPVATRERQDFLSQLAHGEHTPLMTPGLRAALNPNAPRMLATRLNTLTAFTFLTCDEVQGRVVERYGARISQLCYYKMLTGSETYYYTFWLTPQGQVADFRASTE